MRKRIRDLDFDDIVVKILDSTNIATRRVADAQLQDSLRAIKSKADAVRYLRSAIAVAAVGAIRGPDELQFEQPLVHAFVLVHHHPLAGQHALGRLRPPTTDVDCEPRLLEIAAAHPEVTFDLDDLKQTLIDAILVHGDHELDDRKPPWSMHWNGASGAAWAFRCFVVVRALGDITVSYDEAEKYEYDEAMAHLHHTNKNVKR